MIPESNEMRFEVTTRCNYRCIICPRDKLTRKIESMSFKLFRYLFDKIRDESPQYDTMTFPGMGEPLLDKTLCKKISFAKKKKIKVLLLTNASLLTLNKFKEIENAGLDSVRVSIYGHNEKTYSQIHGIKNSGLFNRIKNNLLEISKKKKNTKLLFTYNVVNGCNDLCLDSWVSFWQDKVDLLEVWRPHNWVDARQYRKVQIRKLKTCGRPRKTPLQIQVDGTVNMCCFDFNGKLLLGDLKTQGLKEIFSSRMFEKILRCHATGDFKNSGLICENCDQRNADKRDVMVYNSRFDIKDRVNMVSTTYSKLL